MLKNLIRKSVAGVLYAADRIVPTKGISAILYHKIFDVSGDTAITSISPADFENQLKYLKTHGYRTLTVAEMLDIIKNKKPYPKKSIMITFDDGFADNLEAFKMLNRYGFTAVLFVATAFIGKTFNYRPYYYEKTSMDYDSSTVKDETFQYLSAEQLKEACALGIEIYPHTHHHIDMRISDKQRLTEEIIVSKKIIEEISQKPVNCFSYPFGYFDDEAKKLLKNAGFECSFAVITDNICHDTDLFELPRYNTPPMSDKIIFKLSLTGKIKYYDRLSSASHHN